MSYNVTIIKTYRSAINANMVIKTLSRDIHTQHIHTKTCMMNVLVQVNLIDPQSQTFIH